MGYVIAGVLVVLLIAGIVAFLVLNATEKGGPVADAGERPPGIGPDDTPLGDTREHAGEQSGSGATTADPESGGGRPPADADKAAHVARPGEGEGAEQLGFDGEQPRDADRVTDRGA
jgi:hypothetical protein